MYTHIWWYYVVNGFLIKNSRKINCHLAFATMHFHKQQCGKKSSSGFHESFSLVCMSSWGSTIYLQTWARWHRKSWLTATWDYYIQETPVQLLFTCEKVARPIKSRQLSKNLTSSLPTLQRCCVKKLQGPNLYRSLWYISLILEVYFAILCCWWW